MCDFQVKVVSRYIKIHYEKYQNVIFLHFFISIYTMLLVTVIISRDVR